MRDPRECPHRTPLRGAGAGEVSRCALIEEIAVARLSVARGGGRSRPLAPDGRIRIGFISPCGYLGGAERWHATLIPRLDPRRFAVEGVGILYDDQTHPILMDELAGICPVGIGAGAVRDLTHRVDIVVVWGIAEPGPYLPERSRRPAVVMVMHVDGRNAAAVSMAERAAVDVDHWACVAPAALAAIPPEFRADAAVIPNGVDPGRVLASRGRDSVRREWRIPEGAHVLGFIGRLAPEKNPAAMAEAIEALQRSEGREWVGVVVGDGYDADYASSIRALAARQAGDRVIFTGGRTDVGDCLAGFDALLIPSHSEGCCITLIEGWMAGVPVIATRVGLAASHPDLIVGLDAPTRGDRIADALLHDLGDPARARRVERAREFALENLSADRFAGLWSELLEDRVRQHWQQAGSPSDVTLAAIPPRLLEVRGDACSVCCDGVVPSPTLLNHVIASHLFRLAHELDGDHAKDDRGRRAALALKRSMVPHLRILPARADGAIAEAVARGRCFHLGEMTGLRDCPTCRGSVRIKTFKCHHLLHSETTLRDCRACQDFAPELRGGGVARWAVGVTSAPRREPTLARCLASLAEAGWGAPRLFLEPGVEVPPGFPRVTATRRDRRLGEWPNWLLGLTELVHRYPMADAYLMVQDDTVFCKGVRAYLERVLWPGGRVGAVSVYCPAPYALPEAGWNAVPSRNGVIGALTFLFPNAAARALLAHPSIVDHRLKGTHRGLVDTDGIVGRWAWRAELPIYYHSPSLAQHVGDASSVWAHATNTGNRRSENFVGESHDARLLLKASAAGPA